MTLHYEGSELEVFAAATNWKRYFASICAPYVGRNVLEVGGGIGSNIPYFWNNTRQAWLSVEPDPELAARIEASIANGSLPSSCKVLQGTIDQVDTKLRFDTVMYIDVLEHIGDHAREVEKAANCLSVGGRLIVLSPAHQYLFSPFDAAIGHYRRYSTKTLTALQPRYCRLAANFMLDSIGFFASLANKALLNKAAPTPAQIALWDRVLVPISVLVDKVTGFRFGKTIVVVWEKQPA
jgi:hypothetical protein